MMLRKRMRQVAEQVDALSLRERGLLMLGAFMVLFLVWDWMLMAEISARGKAVNAEIETARRGIHTLNQAIARTAREARSDPNAELQQRLDAARERVTALDEELAARTGQVIPPSKMAGVLENLLRRQGKLTLLNLHSMPPEALFMTPEDAAGELPGAVYRHGLELEVEGRYLDVLDYLQALESLQWKFFWEAVELESDAYPQNRVRIRIYSLNLEEGWLGV